MTPQEEAKKLFDLVYETEDEYSGFLSTPTCKYFATIMVQKLLDENISVLQMLELHGTDRTRLPVKQRAVHLIEVKKEIKKL